MRCVAAERVFSDNDLEVRMLPTEGLVKTPGRVY